MKCAEQANLGIRSRLVVARDPRGGGSNGADWLMGTGILLGVMKMSSS